MPGGAEIFSRPLQPKTMTVSGFKIRSFRASWNNEAENLEFLTNSACQRTEFKAAEDSRTPRRWRDESHATPSARSWSAAVLCRFRRRYPRAQFRSLACCHFVLEFGFSYSENRIEIDGLCGGSFISAPGKSHSSSFNLVQRLNRLVVEPIASSRFAGRLEADLVTKSDDALCKPFGQPLWITSVKIVSA